MVSKCSAALVDDRHTRGTLYNTIIIGVSDIIYAIGRVNKSYLVGIGDDTVIMKAVPPRARAVQYGWRHRSNFVLQAQTLVHSKRKLITVMRKNYS